MPHRYSMPTPLPVVYLPALPLGKLTEGSVSHLIDTRTPGRPWPFTYQPTRWGNSRRACATPPLHLTPTPPPAVYSYPHPLGELHKRSVPRLISTRQPRRPVRILTCTPVRSTPGGPVPRIPLIRHPRRPWPFTYLRTLQVHTRRRPCQASPPLDTHPALDLYLPSYLSGAIQERSVPRIPFTQTPHHLGF